ncbi:glutamine amidotransferase [Rhizomicrobium palustre]|uniref:Imidazole glycerol phosphate synthase subunit HisH n=1 Tax=Rhizomicrobium palustre TaxID=189966 RepID=A0A846MXB4_9PROT|nr:imidazole glycerol phosphate synthase subunit HisH [Rhizomicrobium palustre]NIK88198.1 glutamine amidotransferase [Rhizomicrobium palustre]
MSLVALIDYGSGNLRSAEKALARAAEERGISAQIAVTSDPAVAAKAGRIVLPGVGAFADCMGGLTALPGMVEALREAVLVKKVPFLGICVGMQLMASVGREFGDHKGLNWISGEVIRMVPADPDLKIPHMGWNELRLLKPHPVLEGLENGVHAYFVHSFMFRAADKSHLLATTEYGGTVAAVVGRENIIGTQFHPEKSQATGLTLLGNFLTWTP